jgi:hypothetical protein
MVALRHSAPAVCSHSLSSFLIDALGVTAMGASPVSGMTTNGPQVCGSHAFEQAPCNFSYSCERPNSSPAATPTKVSGCLGAGRPQNAGE